MKNTKPPTLDNVIKKKTKFDVIHFKTFLPAKLCYFGFEASFGCVIPFLTVFLTSVGLSVSQSSWIAGLRTVASLILSPSLNAYADHTNRHKSLLLLQIIALSCIAIPLPWIARSINENMDVVSSINNTTGIPSNNSFNEGHANTVQSPRWLLFCVMLLMISLFSILSMSVAGFLDSAIMKLVAKHKDKTSFGNQRVFGSIGVASGSFSSGLFCDSFKLPEVSKYASVFIVLIPHFLILFIGAIFLEQKPTNVTKLSSKKRIEYESIEPEQTASSKKSVFQSTVTLCKQWTVIFVLFITMHNGINYSAIPGFLSMHLASIGSSSTEMGLASALASVSAVITFPISSRIMTLLGGPFPSFFVSTFSYAVRYMIMGRVQIPSVVIAAQTLHAFGFALFWVALVEYIHKVSPLNISNTMFGVANTLYYSFGIIIANLCGGAIFSRYGGRVLFQVLALNNFFMSAIILLYHVFSRRRQCHNKNNQFLLT